MSMWFGLDNGVPTADMSPSQLAPTTDDQLQWPVWGLNYMSHGEMGEAPDLPRGRRSSSTCSSAGGIPRTDAERADIWRQMLSIYTDQVFSIGLVNSSLQPILVTKKLRNFPDEGFVRFRPDELPRRLQARHLLAGTGRLRCCGTFSGASQSWSRRPSSSPRSSSPSSNWPPGDYFESYIAEIRAQGEGVNMEQIEALRKQYGFDQPPIPCAMSTGRGDAPGRFRLFLRI